MKKNPNIDKPNIINPELRGMFYGNFLRASLKREFENFTKLHVYKLKCKMYMHKW